ncbi:MAG TPA: hypothetical protein PLL69_10925 [Gemmatimonadales bacterium]|nr:hypothetical protein [Gemmatimonadales bacterium]
MTDIFLLEPDDPGPAWTPFAIAAPLADLRAGGWTIAERWARALDAAQATGTVAAHARGKRAPGALPVITTESIRGAAWVVDATFAPRIPMRPAGSARRLLHEGRTVAWRLDPGESWTGPNDQGDGVVVDGIRLHGAWDLITALEQFLFGDTLAALDRPSDPIPDGVTVIGNPGAIALRGALIEPLSLIDVRKGAVILEKGVEVRSGSRLEGPLWIREGGIVSGGQLRQVSAGPHCRLHGEIATTAITGYANKSHDGFIGHSVIGSWVNLGAGTITSNLKNTYGEVKVSSGGTQVNTARTLLGTMFGDHVKTAIGTLLPTGSIVGAGANLFGSTRAAKYTAPFAWGDSGEQIGADRFIEIARRVLPRREVKVDAETEAALREMHRRVTGNG